MGKIVRNGIEFSSTSDTADNINYNNSKSGLTAVTAQEAIDEVNENVSTLTESLEWKVAGSTNVLNGVVTIPSDYKELLVLSTPNQSTYGVIITHIPYMSDSSVITTYEYWGNTTAYTGIKVKRDEKKVELLQVNNGGSNGTPLLKVYYR